MGTHRLPVRWKKKTIAFLPGVIGINYVGNKIIKVFDNSFAYANEVQIGWKICAINNKTMPDETNVIKQTFAKLRESNKIAVVQFDVPKYKATSCDFKYGQKMGRRKSAPAKRKKTYNFTTITTKDKSKIQNLYQSGFNAKSIAKIMEYNSSIIQAYLDSNGFKEANEAFNCTNRTIGIYR